MEFIADLHIHSHLSRACSQDLRPESLSRWSQLKGIQVLATGDFTHPAWFAELKSKLKPAEPGLFALKTASDGVPDSCRAPVRFILGVEISCIYAKAGRIRKIHHLVFAPTFAAAAGISRALAKIGSLSSDGRPILRLDSKDLLAIVRDASDEAFLIPAHAWTPHFGVFGSQSGFETLEECFEERAGEVFAIETGLSSDPPMNWRLSRLDRLALISSSDAHSPERLGREATLFNTDLSYRALFDALRRKDPKRLLGTLEFFPEEGKYHLDGHRKCGVRLEPAETRREARCPVCGRRVTVGVLHRIDSLADRAPGIKPPGAPGYENLVALKSVLADLMKVGSASLKVDREYHRLLALLGPELAVLRRVALSDIERAGGSGLAEAIGRMRRGEIQIEPGYDGEYGSVRISGRRCP